MTSNAQTYTEEAVKEMVDRTNARLEARVRAAPVNTSEAETNRRIALLDYATEEEWAELKAAKEARDAAEAEQRLLTLKAAELEAKASMAGEAAQRKRTARRAAMVAATLGEAHASVAVDDGGEDGPTAEDIRAAAVEIRERAKAKEEEAATHHGQLRSRTIGLFQACAERAGADYLERARRLSEIHAAIGAVQLVLNSLGNVRAGTAPVAIVGQEWNDILIPNAALKALAGVGRVEGAPYMRLPVVGGDRNTVWRAAQGAHEAAMQTIRELVGEWPLSRRG